MEAIMDVASEYNLKVIEDATEALGSHYTEGKYKGKYAGTIGDYGAFSFNGNKIITTGGGGAVTAKSSETVKHLRYLSTQAKDDPHYYIHNEIGYNYRMTNLQAALGVAQMEELPEFICRKQENYDKYKKLFEGFELAKLIEFRQGTESNKWFYSLEIDRDKIKCPMRGIITKLEECGVQTRAIWGLINEQKPYQGEETYRLEKAPYYAERILNIPCSTNITDEEIEYVVGQVKEILNDLACD
jgi:dTDP-4-amino-4,6-dideoxygalactose transaminase